MHILYLQDAAGVQTFARSHLSGGIPQILNDYPAIQALLQKAFRPRHHVGTHAENWGSHCFMLTKRLAYAQVVTTRYPWTFCPHLHLSGQIHARFILVPLVDTACPLDDFWPNQVDECHDLLDLSCSYHPPAILTCTIVGLCHLARTQLHIELGHMMSEASYVYTVLCEKWWSWKLDHEPFADWHVQSKTLPLPICTTLCNLQCSYAVQHVDYRLRHFQDIFWDI